MDITQLILDEHHQLRRQFAMLDQIADHDGEALSAIWLRLALDLRVHADAEEEVFYPELLRLGTGVEGESSPVPETRDALKDHDEIRSAIDAVADHEVGSTAWREAVEAANKANGDHLAEEEREGLADFRRHASLETRHRLGVEFATYRAGRVGGLASAPRRAV